MSVCVCVCVFLFEWVFQQPWVEGVSVINTFRLVYILSSLSPYSELSLLYAGWQWGGKITFWMF